MGYLYQTNSTIANTKKLTISMWAQVPTTTDPVVLLNYGDENNWNSALELGHGTPSNIISFSAYGAEGSYDEIANTLKANMTDPIYSDGVFTPAIEYKTNQNNSALDYNKWFHVIVALDMTNDSSATWNGSAVVAQSWATLYIFVNGVRQQIRCSSLSGIAPRDIGDNPGSNYVSGAPVGSIWATAIPDDYPTHQTLRPAWFDNLSNGDLERITIPAFDLAINTFSVGLPGFPFEQSSSSTPVIYGDTQIWFGTFIDPTSPANLSKFVNISGGKGTPADPAIAAAAFGQQTILFTGNHTQFINNLGTGGSFSFFGSNSDFTPVPSYG